MSRQRTFLFRVSGLVVQSDAPLEGLRPLDASHVPDVRVRMLGAMGAPPVRDADEDWYVSPDRDERGVPFLAIGQVGSAYLLSYAEGASFLVSASGADVDAWWDPPLSDTDAADYLLGGVMAFIARLRGMVPLHASAIVVGDHAVLFAGAAGAGKSSVAAAFAILGYPVLSDDMVVMSDSGAGVLAHPSRARLSVWPDSANSLFPAITLPAHSRVYEKRRLDLLDQGFPFHDRAVPIGMICMLGAPSSSDAPTIRGLRAQDALMRLVSHSYGNYLLDALMRAREFDVLGRVVASVAISEVSFRADLARLVQDCRKVAASFALQSSAHST